MTADAFAARLAPLRAAGDVPMREIFALANEHIDLPPAAIERLLDSDVREERIGGTERLEPAVRRR